MYVCTLSPAEVDHLKAELSAAMHQLNQTKIQLKEKTSLVQDFLQVASGGGWCTTVLGKDCACLATQTSALAVPPPPPLT